MQLLKTLIGASISLAILALVGCESSIDTNNPPFMELDCYELAVTGGGGNIFIYYSVSNPVKNAKPSAKSNVEWITPGEVTDSSIVFAITASDIDEERYGIITIDYPGIEKALKVYITQDKQLLNKFSFNVTDVTYKSCTVEYVPFDKKRPYMANIIDSEYFKQSGITDGALFVAAEMENYLSIAQINKITLEELMERVTPKLIHEGNVTRKFDGMQPGATYTVYSYGIEFSGNTYTMTTPLHTTIVTLPMPTMKDVSFDISVAKHDSMTDISIRPINWDGFYSVQIAPEDSLMFIPEGETPTEYHIKSYADNFYNRARNAIRDGITAEQFLRSSCYAGNKKLNLQISSGKRHMVIVFAVESKDGEIPVMCSMPTIKYL